MQDHKVFIHRLLFCFFSIVLVLGCQKYEEDNFKPEDDGELTTSVDGTVYDESGVELQGTTVTIGNKTAKTDAFGYFEIQDVKVKSRFLVQVKKEGFFEQATEMTASENSTIRQHTASYLLKKQFSNELHSADGGEILVNKTLIHIPANSVTVDSFTPYSGIIKVAVVYINPYDNPNFNLFSNAIGINKQNVQTDISSIGLVALEIQSASGQKLYLKSGTSIKVKIPLNTTPNTSGSGVLLWHFNENTGIWEEQGTALRNGNFITADFFRLGIWNIDASEKLSRISGRIVYNSSPLINQRVFFRESTTARTFVFVTDDKGQFAGRLPLNTSYVMSIKACGFNILEKPITTTSSVTDLSDIAVTSSSIVEQVHKITVKNCLNNPIPYATVYIRLKSQGLKVLKADSVGVVELKLLNIGNCTELPTIQAISPSGEASQLLNISSNSTSQLFITICSEEFLSYQINNDSNYIIKNPKFTANPLSISGGETNSLPYIIIKGGNIVQAIGAYGLSELFLNVSIGGQKSTLVSSSGVLMLETYPSNTSEYYRGSYKFEKVNNNGVSIGMVSGFFNIKRK